MREKPPTTLQENPLKPHMRLPLEASASTGKDPVNFLYSAHRSSLMAVLLCLPLVRRTAIQGWKYPGVYYQAAVSPPVQWGAVLSAHTPD